MVLNGKLRLAKPEDLDQLVELLYTSALEVPEGPPPSKSKLESVLRNLLIADIKQTAVIAYEVDEAIVGYIIGFVNPSIFTEKVLTAELGYYVLPEYSSYKVYAELLDTYGSWAKEIAKADYVAGATYNPRFGKVYERKGYRLTETSYMKEL